MNERIRIGKVYINIGDMQRVFSTAKNQEVVHAPPVDVFDYRRPADENLRLAFASAINCTASHFSKEDMETMLTLGRALTRTRSISYRLRDIAAEYLKVEEAEKKAEEEQ